MPGRPLPPFGTPADPWATSDDDGASSRDSTPGALQQYTPYTSPSTNGLRVADRALAEADSSVSRRERARETVHVPTFSEPTAADGLQFPTGATIIVLHDDTRELPPLVDGNHMRFGTFSVPRILAPPPPPPTILPPPAAQTQRGDARTRGDSMASRGGYRQTRLNARRRRGGRSADRAFWYEV